MLRPSPVFFCMTYASLPWVCVQLDLYAYYMQKFVLTRPLTRSPVAISTLLTNVTVYLHYLFHTTGLHQRWSDPLFYGKNNSFRCLNANSCGTKLQWKHKNFSISWRRLAKLGMLSWHGHLFNMHCLSYVITLGQTWSIWCPCYFKVKLNTLGFTAIWC